MSRKPTQVQQSMVTTVFEYSDYKKFVLDWIQNSPNEGRGQRKNMAEAIGCQTPFITHVLGGDYHFSMEQGEACARFLGLNGVETEFFVLLILRLRAGTKSLESMFSKQISLLREQQAVLKSRLKITESLSAESQMLYYSSWHYAAIHMALLIPALQNLEGLQRYFQIPTARVMNILQFLMDHALIEKTSKGNFRVLRPVIHLEKDSPLLLQHHTHWRLRALEVVQLKLSENLHYSGVISLSENDYEWVREKFSHLLEEIVTRIKDSPDEKLACLNFDFFAL